MEGGDGASPAAARLTFCLRKLSSARGDHGVAAEASDAESVACCERGVLHRSGGTPDTPGPGEPGGIVELEAAQPAIGACGRSDDVLALMWRCSRARAESCPREGRFSARRGARGVTAGCVSHHLGQTSPGMQTLATTFTGRKPPGG